MNFEPKLSGTKVTDFKITPIFGSQIVWLSECMEKIQSQEAMNFLLDEFRFTKGQCERSHDWAAVLDWDTILKISILENYPDYEKELKDHFGDSWLKHYIRFNH